MGSIFGIAKRGFGKALRPKGPGVIRPKPTDRYGQQMKPKPIRPGKKDGGSLNTALEKLRDASLKTPSKKMKPLAKPEVKVRSKKDQADEARRQAKATGGRILPEKFTSEPSKRISPSERKNTKLRTPQQKQKQLQKLPAPKTKSMPSGGKRRAMKNGGFPDLSGDGKITKKDILMGRGVIKKGKK